MSPVMKPKSISSTDVPCFFLFLFYFSLLFFVFIRIMFVGGAEGGFTCHSEVWFREEPGTSLTHKCAFD